MNIGLNKPNIVISTDNVIKVRRDLLFFRTLQPFSKLLKTKEYLVKKIATGTRVGKTGLENKLDSKVIGDVGYKRYEVNAFGKRIKEISIDPGKPGSNFRTTLDLDVQKLASELLKNKSGSVCVMDIYRGDIVSMVSSPVFDSN